MKRLLDLDFKVFFFVAACSLAAPAAGMGGEVGGGNGPWVADPGYDAGSEWSPPGMACSKTTKPLTGTVVNYEDGGGVLILDTGTEIEELYGVGPRWYWTKNDMDIPEVGETVTITAKTATAGLIDKNVLISMTIGDRTISLRDEVTCLPLWREKQRPVY
ncbi:MAG: hypothetical protein U0411_01830 [Thermodesulfovibrionales bacterium]